MTIKFSLPGNDQVDPTRQKHLDQSAEYMSCSLAKVVKSVKLNPMKRLMAFARTKSLRKIGLKMIMDHRMNDFNT